MYILAIIGLICLLWLASKFFNKLGDLLNRIGDIMADYEQARYTKDYGIHSQTKNKKLKEKIATIKGNDTDEEYWKKVHGDIDKLTENE